MNSRSNCRKSVARRAARPAGLRAPRGKLFAIIADRHHGEDAIGLLVKGSGPDEMTGLIEAQPTSIIGRNIMARAAGWA